MLNSRTVAVVVLLAMALLETAAPASLIGAQIAPGSCLAAARQHRDSRQWLEQLAPHSRPMPQLTSDQLGVSDWPEGVKASRNHSGSLWHRCSRDTFRYKVYRGVVYADYGMAASASCIQTTGECTIWKADPNISLLLS